MASKIAEAAAIEMVELVGDLERLSAAAGLAKLAEIIDRAMAEGVEVERKVCADIADRQMRAGGMTRAEADIATTIRNLILSRGVKEVSDG